jgi:hypothetical protein
MSTMNGRHDRRAVLRAGMAAFTALLLEGPIAALAGTRAPGAHAAGAAALVGGGGAFATEAVLLRGCSALSTAVAGIGGSLPHGIAIDFRRSLACLVSGIDRRSIELRTADAVIASSPGSDWVIVPIERADGHRRWRARIGEAFRLVERETNAD